MAKRGRKPVVSDEQVIERMVEAGGVATRPQLDISPQRAGALLDQGVLALRKATQKVTDAEGNPSRGRPAKVYTLSRKVRDRLRRQAQTA